MPVESTQQRSLLLRRRINRLKDELRQLETAAGIEVSEIAVTSSTCGHDDVLDAIQKAARAIGSNSNATLCGFSDASEGGRKWFYSTTFVPQDLEYYLPDADEMVQFFDRLTSSGVLELLHRIWCNNDCACESDETLPDAELLGLVERAPPLQLTANGVQVLMVLAHLYYVTALKPKPQTALRMLPAIAEIFDIDPMTDVLDADADEAMDCITESGRLTEIAPTPADQQSLRTLLHELSSPTRQRMARRDS